MSLPLTNAERADLRAHHTPPAIPPCKVCGGPLIRFNEGAYACRALQLRPGPLGEDLPHYVDSRWDYPRHEMDERVLRLLDREAALAAENESLWALVKAHEELRAGQAAYVAGKQEGQRARHAGEPATANPHPDGPARDGWARGWEEMDTCLRLKAAEAALRQVEAYLAHEQATLLAQPERYRARDVVLGVVREALKGEGDE